MAKRMPRYPVYIPSKGRFENCLTAKAMERSGIPYRLVVEEPEAEEYAARFGDNQVLVLPFTDQGSVIPARNWIKDHATAEGHTRHWQFDDNIRGFLRRMKKGRRVPMDGGIALALAEDFTERYTNVPVSGLNYDMFLFPNEVKPPFHLNCRVYSCSLILNSIPYRWRGTYNEDTDLCLQVIAGGECTILFNAFLVDKLGTMRAKGGNTDELYLKDDGRLKMARELERRWPGVVETRRRFDRPQHAIRYSWRKFDTPLIRRPDFELPEGPDEHGMRIQVVKPIKNPHLRSLVEDGKL